MNQEQLDVQAGFRKCTETRDQIANICWIIEKAKAFQKNIYCCFINYTKAFDYVDHNKLWKILRDGNTRPRYLLPEKPVCSQEAIVRTGHGTTNWFQIGKEYIEVVYCHPAYLTYMQSTLCDMPGWMKHKLESRLSGEISITSDMQIDTTLMAESEEELKSLLMKVKKLA